MVMKSIGKIVVSLAFMSATLALPGAPGTAVAGGAAHGERTFVPSGHAYGPGQTYLPGLNTRQSDIEAQADIRQTEIYNSQLRQQRFQEMFRNFQNLDNYAPRNGYRY